MALRRTLEVDPELARLLAPLLLHDLKAVPARLEGGTLAVWMQNPDDRLALRLLAQRTGRDIQPLAVDEGRLAALLKQCPGWPRDKIERLSARYARDFRVGADGVVEVPWMVRKEKSAYCLLDRLLDVFMASGKRVLFAQYHRRLGGIVKVQTDLYDDDEVLTLLDSEGEFRALLDHMGRLYMGNPIYGGHARLQVRYREGTFQWEIFMANSLGCGFWFKLYSHGDRMRLHKATRLTRPL